MAKVESRYTNSVSFRSIGQGDILSTRLDDLDRRHEVSHSLEENPSYRVFPENPLHMGYFLDSICIGTVYLE